MSSLPSTVAFHEAGHLVLAVYNGLPLGPTISATGGPGGSQGHVQVLRLPPGGSISREEYAVRRLTCLYGGMEAERAFVASRRRSRDGGCMGDLLAALEESLAVFGTDNGSARHATERARRRAREQVRRLEAPIRRVAALLEGKGTFRAKDVRDYLYSLLSPRQLLSLAARTHNSGTWLLQVRGMASRPRPLSE